MVSSEQNILMSLVWQNPWSPLLFKTFNHGFDSWNQHLLAKLSVVIKLVGIGRDNAGLVVSEVVTDLLVAILVFAEAPIWTRRWFRFSVLLLVTKKGGCLIPMTLPIGLQVRCNTQKRYTLYHIDDIEISWRYNIWLTFVKVTDTDPRFATSIRTTASDALRPLCPS